MIRYRCPDAGHGDEAAPLKSNNDRVYECARLHKFWLREEEGVALLVELISGEAFPAAGLVIEDTPEGDRQRPRLNFMVDVPRLTGGLDFNNLSLSPPQWKVISRIDGKSNLEEVRLLSGLTPPQTEQVIFELQDAGLIEVRRRGGR